MSRYGNQIAVHEEFQFADKTQQFKWKVISYAFQY